MLGLGGEVSRVRVRGGEGDARLVHGLVHAAEKSHLLAWREVWRRWDVVVVRVVGGRIGGVVWRARAVGSPHFL